VQRRLRCSEGFRGFIAPILGLISGFMAAWAIFAWAARGTAQQVVLAAVVSIVSAAIGASEVKMVQSPAKWSALLSRVLQQAHAGEEDEAAWDGDDDDVGPSAQASAQAALRTSARRAVQRRPISIKAVHSVNIDNECLTPGSEASAPGLRRRRSRTVTEDFAADSFQSPSAVAMTREGLVNEPVKADAAAQAADEAPPGSVESTTASSCRDSESGEAEASSDGAVAPGQLGNVQQKALTRRRRSASCGDDSEARDSWSWRQERETEDDDFDVDWSFDEDDEGDIVSNFRRSWSEGDMEEYARNMADEDPTAELFYLSSSALQLHQSKEAPLGHGSAEEGVRVSSAADVLAAFQQSRGHRLLGA